jgi:hypothetical protein
MYLEVSWLFISQGKARSRSYDHPRSTHLLAFPLSNKRFVANPDLPWASGLIIFQDLLGRACALLRTPLHKSLEVD